MFENLVFSGGGVLGIAHVGALEDLDKLKYLDSIKNVLGSSAGSLVALLLSVDYSISDIKQIALDLDFSKLIKGNIFSDFYNLLHNKGIYSTSQLRNEILKLMNKKIPNANNLTFAKLHEIQASKNLYVVASNVNTTQINVFSYEQTPQVKVIDAVIASMSLPLFFEPQELIQGGHTDYLVDGGLFRSFYFDFQSATFDKTKTLGIRLESDRIYKEYEQDTPMPEDLSSTTKYMTTILNSLIDSGYTLYRNSKEELRQIIINTGKVDMTNFNLTMQDKEFLLNQGKLGVADWLKRKIKSHSYAVIANQKAKLAESTSSSSQEGKIEQTFELEPEYAKCNIL